VTSIPEIVGDGGILLPPEDEGAWADALLDVVDSSERRAELGERGPARARRFSWRKTAEETVHVYREVLGA
jgi:glycosyltransferase involved in cell wall biosynthesis